MNLGQEIPPRRDALRGRAAAREAAALPRKSLGATAIGTCINRNAICAKVSSGSPISPASRNVAPNLVEATQDAGSFVQLRGC